MTPKKHLVVCPPPSDPGRGRVEVSVCSCSWCQHHEVFLDHRAQEGHHVCTDPAISPSGRVYLCDGLHPDGGLPSLQADALDAAHRAQGLPMILVR